MRLKTFRAPTMADALAAVKKDLGKDAVILHTRTTRTGWLAGLLGRKPKNAVEVIASTDVNVAAPKIRAAQAGTDRAVKGKPQHEMPRAVSEQAAASAMPANAAAKAYARVASGAGREAARGGVKEPASSIEVKEKAPDRPVAPPVVSDEASVTMPVRPRNDRGRVGIGGTSRPSLAVPATLAPQDGAAIAVLEAELGAIKRMVGQVLRASGPSTGTPLMPEALFKQYVRLLDGQVARDLADQLMGQVRDELTPSELCDESIVRQTILRHLSAMIPVASGVAAPAKAADGRPLTISLVGPTGVGKTTTVAKLAATYKLRHGRKVGLITCDTYRIAAVDQLRTYANIISVPLKVALTPAEMSQACESFAGLDVVLIDTAGRSQNDTARLDELRSFIEAARPHQTHLVLSSTAAESVMLKAAERFGATSPTHLILTKLDEAVNFGVLLSIARRANAALSYVTTGQEVPDHIEPGQADRLARLVLDGELAR